MENDIADGLSKCAALKLPVEPGIFVLKLTQPSVTPSTGQSKKRKLASGDYLPADLPETAAKVPKINNQDAEEQSAPADPRVCTVEAGVPDKPSPGRLAGGPSAPAEPQVLVVEVSAPRNEEVLLVFVVEPQAPTWAQQIAHYLQTGEPLKE